MKKLLTGLLAVAVIVVAGIWFLTDDLEHIEDTNGPDDYTLTTITDETIVNRDMGALNPVSISRGIFQSGVEFSSENFTGVYEILYDNYIGESDFCLDLQDFTVTGGNFKMVVVHDDEIVATIEPDALVEYRLENVTGYVSLRIAGESASYSFRMFESDYDLHTHD